MVTKIINEFGDIIYYNEQGLRHREDGPAIEYTNGNKLWYINGLYHRIDGPAYDCEWKAYYIMGKHLTYEVWFGIKDFPLLW